MGYFLEIHCLTARKTFSNAFIPFPTIMAVEKTYFVVVKVMETDLSWSAKQNKSFNVLIEEM